MKKITKKLVIIAVIGAAAFVLHSNSGFEAPTGDIGDTNIQTVAGGDSKVLPLATAGEVSVAGRESALYYLDESVALAASYVETMVSTPAPGRSREIADEQAEKEQVARSKMSGPVAALAAVGGDQPADLIVAYADHPELFEDGRIESLGGEILRHYEVLKLLAVRLPADALVELAIEDNVDHVSLDDVVAASSVSSRVAANDPVYPSGNTAYTGDDTGVAILDSGVAFHADLSSYIKQYDFRDGKYPQPEVDDDDIEKYNSSSRVDEYGHGTHVAGIIAGRGKYSSGDYSGPATRSEIVSLRVLDSSGHGSMSDVMAALDWLLQYGSYFDIGVVNLSLGKPVTESNETDPLVLAIEQVWDEGMVVVVAAGNFGREGYFSTTSPGNSRKVITVGSLTDNSTGADFSDDYVSSYSSRGPTPGDHVAKPDLVAPGNRLVATTPAKSELGKLLPGLVVPCSVAVKCEFNYMTLSGTSMATGMVSAAAAMMLDKDSHLSPATVKARLMRSARKVDESPVVAGAGLLDIDAALNETGVVHGDALSPLLVYDAATGGTLIEDTSELWGGQLWGAGYIWTDGGGISANGYVWTDGGVSANGYIWTDGSIWANGYLWTDNDIAAFGYIWTDGGINANGYIWTDGGGVDANGYIWTDGGGVRGLALFDLYSANPSLNDDEPTSD